MLLQLALTLAGAYLSFYVANAPCEFSGESLQISSSIVHLDCFDFDHSLLVISMPCEVSQDITSPSTSGIAATRLNTVTKLLHDVDGTRLQHHLHCAGTVALAVPHFQSPCSLYSVSTDQPVHT